MSYEGVAYRVTTRAPLVTDDVTKGFAVGSLWKNTVGNILYFCSDNTVGTAQWSNYLKLSFSGANRVDATAANVNVTLPYPQSLPLGYVHLVVKTDSTTNTVTITPTSGVTIDGLTVSRKLYFQNDVMMVQSDGLNWHILNWQINGEVPLTFNASQPIDLSQIPYNNGKAVVIASANMTLLAFTNYVKGQKFLLYVKQDATGGRTLSLTSGVAGGQRLGTAPVLPTTFTAAKKWKYGFAHDAGDDRFDLIGIAGEF